MLSVPGRNSTTTRFLIGTALLLCALTFYYFAVLKVDYYKTGLLDLGWADASWYFAQAKAIMKDGYPYLNFGYKKLPSIWPSGYPALMLPWLKILFAGLVPCHRRAPESGFEQHRSSHRRILCRVVDTTEPPCAEG